MQYAIFCVLLLTICGSVIMAAERKVLLVAPKQIRRSPVVPWQGRIRSPHFRKSHYEANEEYPHFHNRPNSIIYGKPAFRYNKNHLPHGGDDFDQGHEGVNHVVIPHGKGISHGLSFGRGYIPYDNVKGGFTRLNEDHSSSEMHGHEESPQEEFKFSPRDPSFNSQSESGSIFSEDSDSYNLELHGKIDENSKSFNSRSIGKDLFGSKNLFDSTNNAFGPEGKPDQSRSPDFLKSSDFSSSSIISNTETTSPAPIFIPSPKIGGSSHGIVIRDSVSLDDYHRKVEELTKSWPGVINIPGIHGTNIAHAAPTIHQLSASSFAESSFPAASPWTSSFAQGRKGYAVKEDIIEPPVDFRTMPIPNTQHYSFPLPANANLPNIQNSYG